MTMNKLNQKVLNALFHLTYSYIDLGDVEVYFFPYIIPKITEYIHHASALIAQLLELYSDGNFVYETLSKLAVRLLYYSCIEYIFPWINVAYYEINIC